MNDTRVPNVSSEQLEVVLRLLRLADEGVVGSSSNNELLTQLERPCALDGLQQIIVSWITSWLPLVLQVEERAAAIINAAHEQELTGECASKMAVHLAQVAGEGLAWRVTANKVLIERINSMEPNDRLSDLLNTWSTEQNELTDRLVAISEAVEAGRPAGQLLH